MKLQPLTHQHGHISLAEVFEKLPVAINQLADIESSSLRTRDAKLKKQRAYKLKSL